MTIIHFTLDSNNSPVLTKEQIEQLDSLKDRDIDLSDIPCQCSKCNPDAKWYRYINGVRTLIERT